MKNLSSLVALGVLLSGPVAGQNSANLPTISALTTAARLRTVQQARVPLGEAGSTFLHSEGPSSYQRALSALGEAGEAFDEMFEAVLYRGTLPAELKMAMGLRIAQRHSSPYVTVHLSRMLQATGRGRELLLLLQTGRSEGPRENRTGLALEYALLLTNSIHGVENAEFRKVRSWFTDSEIVELTLTTCFFNYFTRFAETLRLPVEHWALETKFGGPRGGLDVPQARVSLLTDPVLQAATNLTASTASQPQRGGLGLRSPANSMRAMMLCPEIAQAWRNYWGKVRTASKIDPELNLQVSFAVSMANGCRYCTLHQVQGLRRLGVSPTKLVAMKKDDSALTPKELAAVRFARKVTSDPHSVSDRDYQDLSEVLGHDSALGVVLQTCTFAFMNRFTDGLHLPSEDEAIRTYREVYGRDFARN